MRAFALIFGIIFLIFGIAGFTSIENGNDHFVNVFKVNISLNILHALTGIVAVVMAWMSRKKCFFFFQILGSFYAALALLGFIYGNHEVLGIFANNRPDTWFHVIVAIAALILGYGTID